MSAVARIVIVVVGLALVFALAACAPSKPPVDEQAASSTTVTAAEVPLAADTATVDRKAPQPLPPPGPDDPHWSSMPPLTRQEVRPVAPIAAPPVEITPIDAWPGRYHEAARGLAGWVHENPEAAHAVFRWEQLHPMKMHVLVQWAITHRYEPITAFFADRHGWEEFAPVERQYPDQVEGLLHWCRSSPEAASELAAHPRAFTWAAAHLSAPPAEPPRLRTRKDDTRFVR